MASPARRRPSVWPFIGYAALAVLAFAKQGRPRDNQPVPNRNQPPTGAFGTTRSTDEPRGVQHERAQQPGRGRHATAPWRIPWTGWKDIFWRTYQQINDDRLLAVAAGVVFYGLLALFPGNYGIGIAVWTVCQPVDDQRPPLLDGRSAAGRRVPDLSGSGEPARLRREGQN